MVKVEQERPSSKRALGKLVSLPLPEIQLLVTLPTAYNIKQRRGGEGEGAIQNRKRKRERKK